MTLSELQRVFQSRVLQQARGIESLVPGTERLDTETRLGTYENAFVARLVEALADTYPALRNAMGESDFFMNGHRLFCRSRICSMKVATGRVVGGKVVVEVPRLARGHP